MKKYKNLFGNAYHKDYSNDLWDSWAWDLGFSNRREMLVYLYIECTMKMIAKFLGVAISTVHYQFKKLDILPKYKVKQNKG